MLKLSVEMGALREPLSLVSCACTALVDLLVVHGQTSGFNSENFEVLSRFLIVLPDNLFNLWAKQLLRELRRQGIASDLQYLAVSSKLAVMDVDSFPSFKVPALSTCSTENSSLQTFACKYESFFWSHTELELVENFITRTSKLRSLTLRHVNLKNNPGFLANIGKHCKNIEILDLSYSSIPQSELGAIPDHFQRLTILVLLQKTCLGPYLNSVELSEKILTTLQSLTLFEDGASEWSAVLPAFHRLTQKLHTGKCAAIERLAAHHILPVHPELVNFVEVVTLHQRILQQPPHCLVAWLKNSFPRLKALRLDLNCVALTTLNSFLEVNFFNITEIHVKINKHVDMFVQTMRCLIPKLSRLHIVNEASLADSSSSNREEVSGDYTARLAFRELEHLSFTGRWDAKLARLLLADSTKLTNLYLKVDFFPLNLSSMTCFPNLNFLTIDHSLLNWWDHTSPTLDIEVKFLSEIVSSALSLKQLSLKHISPDRKKILLRSLKNRSPNLEIA